MLQHNLLNLEQSHEFFVLLICVAFELFMFTGRIDCNMQILFILMPWLLKVNGFSDC